MPAGLLLPIIVRRLLNREWIDRALALGALNFAIFWMCRFVAAQRLPGGVAATLRATQALMVIVLARGLRATAISLPPKVGHVVGNPAVDRRDRFLDEGTIRRVLITNGFLMTLSMTFGAPCDWLLPIRILLAAFLVLGPGATWACSPPDRFRVPVDRPITMYSDGSFVDASPDDEWSFLRGGPVRDVGGGRVGQVLEEDPFCDLEQRLLFVDCTTSAAILVDGREPEEVIWTEDGNYLAASALHLQPPHGPLALTASTTVAEVAAIAAREGWTVETDVPAYAAERGRRNAFNPFLGCEIFYPGSVGTGR